MKIKMPSGVILECFDDSINQSRLERGGIEIPNVINNIEKTDTVKKAPNKRKTSK